MYNGSITYIYILHEFHNNATKLELRILPYFIDGETKA